MAVPHFKVLTRTNKQIDGVQKTAGFDLKECVIAYAIVETRKCPNKSTNGNRSYITKLVSDKSNKNNLHELALTDRDWL